MRWKMIVLLFSLFVFVQVQAQRMEKVDKKAFGLFQRARVAFQEGERKKALLKKLKGMTSNFQVYICLKRTFITDKAKKRRKSGQLKRLWPWIL